MLSSADMRSACDRLWPTDTGTANTVKRAVALQLLEAAGNTTDMSKAGQTLQQQLKVKSVCKFLRKAADSPPKSLLLLLRQDRAFTLTSRNDSRGRPSFWDVHLDVAYVARAGGAPAAAGGDSVRGVSTGLAPPRPQALLLSPRFLTPAAAGAHGSFGTAGTYAQQHAIQPGQQPQQEAQIGVLLLQQPRAGMAVGGNNPPAASFSAQTSYQQQHQNLQHPSGATHAQQTAAIQARQQPQQEAQIGVLLLQQPRAGMAVGGNNPPAASFGAQTSYHQHQHLQPPNQHPAAAAMHARPVITQQGGQHTPGTPYELHMLQQADGSYVALLSQYSRFSSQQGLQDRSPAAGGVADNDMSSLLQLLSFDPQLLRLLQPYVRPDASPYLVDLCADVGRPITLRLSDRSSVTLPVQLNLTAALNRLQQVSGQGYSHSHNNSNSNAARASGSCFGDTNRLGVAGSLHRISAMRDRHGGVYGLTYRVGRHVPGVATLLADVLSALQTAARGDTGAAASGGANSLVSTISSQPSKGLLLVGRPGVGKTTLLRDIARLMSVPRSQGGLGMSVVVVDTSNEIAGDSEQPHSCIGAARRMMVPRRDQQAAVMIEAVMNHTPEVVIVDEIATKEEAAACRTIAQRGVVLVSTAHGSSLADLLRNPDLQGVMGGVKAVTLGDEPAAQSNGGRKTRLERGGAVTFGSLVEILDTNRWRLHPDVAASVDVLLAHSSSSSSSSSTPNTAVTDLDTPQHTHPGVRTQLRSREVLVGGATGMPQQGGVGSSSKMVVTFESSPGWGPAAAAGLQGQRQSVFQPQQQQQQFAGFKRGREEEMLGGGVGGQHNHNQHNQAQRGGGVLQPAAKKAKKSGQKKSKKSKKSKQKQQQPNQQQKKKSKKARRRFQGQHKRQSKKNA